MPAAPLFTAPQTMTGQLAMPTDALGADAVIANAPTTCDALAHLEAALAAGVPIADLLAAQTERLDLEPRYVVKEPTNAGTYAQQFGWTVIDTATAAADYCAWAVMSGSEGEARRWARDLNAR